MPIYTLTLEERRTCPRSCHHWASCYGNGMNWARRNEAGPALEAALATELALYQRRHRQGFVIRCHILGDFYSVDYVHLWERWLDQFPGLHVFGFTAWDPRHPIGEAVLDLAARHWDRFAIRRSLPATLTGFREAVTVHLADPLPRRTPDGAIVCPAQRGATEACGTCGLCWATDKNIAFAIHGRRAGRHRRQHELPLDEPEGRRHVG